MRRTWPLAVALIYLSLAGLPLLSGCSSTSGAAASVAEAEARANAATPAPTPRSLPTPRATPTPVIQPTSRSAGGPLQPPYAPPPASARLVISSIGVDAPLIPVGVTGEGEVESPTEGNVVGWYNLSPVPGARGNSVLVGHVDWHGSKAVFWRLRELKPDDRVDYRDGGRVVAAYRVDWVQSFHVNAAPLEAIFASTQSGKLTIITCEGVFDPATRNYQHRLVVRASYVDHSGDAQDPAKLDAPK
jgi:LPXTG-site transpeptidase (sortase) family protein